MSHFFILCQSYSKLNDNDRQISTFRRSFLHLAPSIIKKKIPFDSFSHIANDSIALKKLLN